MVDKHLSSQFNIELNAISAQVMALGGMVEKQIAQAVDSLSTLDAVKAQRVMEFDQEVNQLEMKIDHELTTVIARRQPTARDLRLLVAISKTTTNLERAGDEAFKIARMVKLIVESEQQYKTLPIYELRIAAELAQKQIRNALNALARLDVDAAFQILQEDSLIDMEFDGFMRKLVTYMMEDPRTISMSLNLLFIAKALERIGDHATNIAEFVIYIVKGADVRHISLEQVDMALRS